MNEQQETPNPCRRCRRQREFFYYMHDTYKFDVDMAWDFIAEGREPVEVSEESVRISIERCIIDEEHVGHVQTQYPGLIAHVQYHEEDGTIVKGHLLIDGHHRAARCRRENKPFHAYLLTEEESAAIVIRTPYLAKGPAAMASERKSEGERAVA